MRINPLFIQKMDTNSSIDDCVIKLHRTLLNDMKVPKDKTCSPITKSKITSILNEITFWLTNKEAKQTSNDDLLRNKKRTFGIYDFINMSARKHYKTHSCLDLAQSYFKERIKKCSLVKTKKKVSILQWYNSQRNSCKNNH